MARIIKTVLVAPFKDSAGVARSVALYALCSAFLIMSRLVIGFGTAAVFHHVVATKKSNKIAIGCCPIQKVMFKPHVTYF